MNSLSKYFVIFIKLIIFVITIGVLNTQMGKSRRPHIVSAFFFQRGKRSAIQLVKTKQKKHMHMSAFFFNDYCGFNNETINIQKVQTTPSREGGM